MARPKEFDEQGALTKALQIFWRQGYANTSLQDLTEVMSISRQSLYDTFGDKHALYLATMRHYIQTEGARWIRPLFEDMDVRSALRRTFENIVDESSTDPHRAGCFTVNAAVECAPEDTEVVDCLLEAVSTTEACFYMAIAAAQAEGKLALKLNAKALASYFLNSVRGLRVMARLKPDRSTMQAIVDVTLSVLD